MPDMRLPGEGDTKQILRVRERVCCDNCGEPADEKHTYLLPNARRNPKSAGYGKDEISWCSDHEVFSCDACRKLQFRGRPPQEGYEWCATFSLFDRDGKPTRFVHMFLRWVDHETLSIEAA